MRNAYGVGTVTIPSGSSASDAIPYENIRGAERIQIEAPDDLTGSVTVQVSDPGEDDWDDYQGDSGSAIDIPSGVVTTFEAPGDKDLRVNSGGNEAADRDFAVHAIEELR